MSPQDAYAILGLAGDATKIEIRQRYKALARKYHPDCEEADPAKFKAVREAYGVLSPGGIAESLPEPQPDFSGIPHIAVAVRLTSRQMREGHRIQLEIYQPKVCMHCGGTGTWEDRIIQCPICNGTGNVGAAGRMIVLADVPPGSIPGQQIVVSGELHGPLPVVIRLG